MVSTSHINGRRAALQDAPGNHTTGYLRLPFSFDVARLKADLAKIRETEWIAHFNADAYEGEWCCVPLRSVGGRTDDIMSLSDVEYADTAILGRCPFFREVIDSFVCEKTSIRLMSMAAGGRIRMHRDSGTSFGDGLARLHIPIVTAPEVLFTIDEDTVHFSAGDTWYMDANCMHGVHNDSDGPRIHLMMDCIVNPWLERVFTEAGFIPAEKPKYGDASINDDNVADIISMLRTLGTEAAGRLAAQLERTHEASCRE